MFHVERFSTLPRFFQN